MSDRSIWQRLKANFARRRRLRANFKVESPPPLREFVYLDEVSLKSLLSSQLGDLREETTEERSTAHEAEIAAVAGISAIGIETNSRYQLSKSNGTQTLRKSLAQSQFKEFIELMRSQVLFSEQPVPSEGLAGGETNTSRSQLPSIAVDEVLRGDLIEVSVSLAADPIYRFSAMMSEMSDMAERYPEMVSAPETAAIYNQMGPVNRVLQQLMVGLVPIRATCTDLSLLYGEDDDDDDDAKLVRIKPNEPPSGRAFDIAGVAEVDLFWKDIRRLVFSGDSFRMLCRIAKPGMRTEWTSVKGAEVLTEILPTFSNLLDTASRSGLSPSRLPTRRDEEEPTNHITRILVREICSFSGYNDEAELLEVARACGVGAAQQHNDLSSRRAVMNGVLSAVNRALPTPIPRSSWAEIRSRVESALTAYADEPAISEGAEISEEPRNPLLEVEIIAIYW